MKNDLKGVQKIFVLFWSLDLPEVLYLPGVLSAGWH